MIENAVYVEEKVAVWYYQPMPKAIKLGDRVVVFDCQHAVSMAFVDEDLVAQLLAYKGGCCGKQRQVVFLATEVLLSHWKDGKGGRK